MRLKQRSCVQEPSPPHLGGIFTKAVHGAQKMHDGLGSVNMPIYQTSTFRFKDVEHGRAAFAGEVDDFVYTRINNPTVRELEQTLAVLENGAECICTSSGMGAVNTVFFALLGQGKHVVCHQTVYGPSRSVLEGHFSRFGVEVSFVDTTKVAEVVSAIKDNTVLIYLESPANPTVDVSDIRGITEAAQANSIPVCVDNTFLGPALQTPLDLGADIVLHSMTKSINGHADVVAGALYHLCMTCIHVSMQACTPTLKNRYTCTPGLTHTGKDTRTDTYQPFNIYTHTRMHTHIRMHCDQRHGDGFQTEASDDHARLLPGSQRRCVTCCAACVRHTNFTARVRDTRGTHSMRLRRICLSMLERHVCYSMRRRHPC